MIVFSLMWGGLRIREDGRMVVTGIELMAWEGVRLINSRRREQFLCERKVKTELALASNDGSGGWRY